ncbi:MAG: zinc carboxypeptidase, partial [Flavobacteriaceae bacterium]|nr:zinc carboxypeptidase [Flavobacteriaceae bacterium]
FAPAAEPFHEVISDWQRDFQTQIGKNHAKYFDKNGWLYFTKESFDLLYPSYGDTYPTFMGAIGMTYEQAGHGRAGLGIDTDHGYELTLVDRIAHHKTTGLSTVEIASSNATKLNSEFKKFFDNKKYTYKSYVLKNENKDKTERLIRLLDKHEIAYEYANKGQVRGYNYQTQKESRMTVSDRDLVVHTNQPKGKMVKVLFEPYAKLVDSLTYDITAWSIPYAHGFKALASKTKVSSRKDVLVGLVFNRADKNAYAYITKWNSLEDAAYLGDLLEANITPRFAEQDFTIEGQSYK